MVCANICTSHLSQQKHTLVIQNVQFLEDEHELCESEVTGSVRGAYGGIWICISESSKLAALHDSVVH